MWRYLNPLLIVVSLLTIGCSNSEKVISKETESIIFKNHSYEEVDHLMIEWKNMFLQEKEQYYVYVFSKTCGHCREIKNQVIDYALSEKETIFFIEYNNEILIIDDRDILIGVHKIDKCGILGVPSLFEIKEQKVSNYYLGEIEVIEILQNCFSLIEN